MIPPLPPSIVAQPQSGLINVGNPARFVVSVSGTAPFTYQWRRNGVPIGGANGSSYMFATTSVADAAAFDVVVSSAAGTVTSALATLSFNQLPPSQAPRSNYVRLGEPVALAIAPLPGANVSYRWLRNGVDVISATDSSLSIPAVGAGDLGGYTVVVDDGVSAPTTRGPAVVALRGTGTLGRKLIAVGAGGALLTSDDGLAWTPRVTGVATDLRGVAATGSTAVAVGVGGTILVSSNGSQWAPLPVGNPTSLNAVAAGPDRFVTVGDGGRVLVSADGTAWYLAGSATNFGLNAVAYGKGVYVFAGSNGALFTSPDGFAWTNRNSETTNTITLLTFAVNQFWALTTSNELLTSPDGVIWTRGILPAPGWLRSIAYDGQKLIAIGVTGGVTTSVDGITWTPGTSGSAQTLLALTWTGDELPATVVPDLDFRIVSQPRSFSATPGLPASFAVTATGAGHTYQWFKDGTPLHQAIQRTLTIAGATAADVGEYAVQVTSPAGVLLSRPALLALLGTGPLANQFLAVGAAGTVLGSGDGVSFIERASGGGQVLRAVAVSAFRAVAVGRDNAIGLSGDGAIWSFRSLLLPGSPGILRGIAAGRTQFVAVGSGGTILVSFDQGETWTPVPSGTTCSLWSVVWDQHRFVAVGEGGVVLASLDGTAWAAVASPTTERLYAVVANGPKLITVTEAGRAFESSDGATSWQAAGTSGAWWVRSAVLAPFGRRVAVGDRGVIATSTNGTSWSLANSPTSQRLYGVIWTGAGATLSGNVADAVDGPSLRIVSEPIAMTAVSGGTANFSVAARGVSPFSYQWQRNGVDVPGGNLAVLVLGNVQPADAGSYVVVISNPTGTITSVPATLAVVPPGIGIAPTITESPAHRSASVGGATNFHVVAAGSLPLTYRWHFNGQTIPGALTSTLALTNLQLANAGSYTVTVANAHGSITSSPAVLSVTNLPGMPVITMQPVGQAVAAGTAAALIVGATGTPTLTYQWFKDDVAVSGATTATFTLDPVLLSHAGVYHVVVANSVGSVKSEAAGLTVVPPGTMAEHRQTGFPGYTGGATVTIANRLSFIGEAQSLGWEVLVPSGWSLAAASGAQGDIRPNVGDTQLLSWAWSTPPASPVDFSYTLNVPAGAAGSYSLAGLAVVRQGGVPIRLIARPDPLVLAPATSIHSADTNGDSRLNLFELTRVIELYNTRNGSVRTGAYTVASAANVTEDGFSPDAARDPSTPVALARFHSADTQGSNADSPRDGALGLFELTRTIQLYNFRTGTVRTGRYHVQTNTEDGFAPGP